MVHAHSKSILAGLLGVLALFTASHASAQTSTGGTAGAASLSTTDFTFYLLYYDVGQDDWVQMDTTQQTYFFNRARCECDGDTAHYAGYVKVAIKTASTTATTIKNLLTNNHISAGEARLYASGNGVNCLMPNAYATMNALEYYCVNLLDPSNYTYPIAGGMTAFEHNLWESPPIPVAWLFGSTSAPVCGANGTSCDSTSTCTQDAITTIWFWAQTTANALPDLTDTSLPVSLAGEVSYAPTSVTAEGSNQALNVTWVWPSGYSPSIDTNFMGVQLFCQRGDGAQVFKPGSFDLAYLHSPYACPDNAPATSSGGLAQLDANYLCSGLLPSTSTSHRITGLQNGTSYSVGAAAVDKYGNISALSNIVYATPSADAGDTGGTLGTGGNGGSVDAGTNATFANGCSCAIRGKHHRNMNSGILWLAAMALAITRRRPVNRK